MFPRGKAQQIIHITEGPRITAGYVITLGRAHTLQRLINNDIKDVKPDRPLTEAALLTAKQSLQPHWRLRLGRGGPQSGGSPTPRPARMC